MKIKITKKQLNQMNCDAVIRGGYCEFQTLLRGPNVKENFYSCGVYGWNWDAFEVEGRNNRFIYVCTGYRDMTGERVEGLEKFEAKARKIWDYNNKKTYEEKQKAHKILIKNFVDYVLKKLGRL